MNNDFKSEFYRRTYKYSLDVLNFIKSLPSDSATRIIVNQLIRSATSVTANIFEAKSASSKKDYINFYTYSLKSANESQLWLNLVRDYLNLKSQDCSCLIKETQELGKILAASILTMKGKRNKI